MKINFKNILVVAASFVLIFVLVLGEEVSANKKKNKKKVDKDDVTWSKSGCGNFDYNGNHYGGSDSCRILKTNCPPPAPPPPPVVQAKPKQPPTSVECKVSEEGGVAVKDGFFNLSSKLTWTGSYEPDRGGYIGEWTFSGPGYPPPISGPSPVTRQYDKPGKYRAFFRVDHVESKCSATICEKGVSTDGKKCNLCESGYSKCNGVCAPDTEVCDDDSGGGGGDGSSPSSKNGNLEVVKIESFISSPIIIPKSGDCKMSWKFSGNPDICVISGTDRTSSTFQAPTLVTPGSYTVYNLNNSSEYTLTCTNTTTRQSDSEKASCIVNPSVIEF